MLNYQQIKKRFDKAKANKLEWEHHLRECYRYALPQKNTFDKRSKGAKKREYVFDSTAEDGLEDYATRMESELVPANQNWIALTAGTEISDDKKVQVETHLDLVTDIVFSHIKSSNFSAQVHSSFLDLGISTGALICEEGDGIQSALNFRSVSLSELYVEESQRGILETTFRDMTINIGDITSIWKRAKLNDKLKEMLERDPTIEIKVIEATIELEAGSYQSVVLYEEHFLIDEALESTPWVVFRESTIPGETYGRGRVMRALADIKTLNKMMYNYLTALEWWSTPTFTGVADGIINPSTIKIVPGSVIAVDDNSTANPSLRPLAIAGRPELLDYAIGKLQDNVRRILISKPFGNVEETPVRSATEMSIRNADLAKTSLGASGRIQNELLERIIKRAIYILTKAGKIPSFKVDGKEVAIRMTSPASRIQDEQQLASMGRFGEFAQMLDPQDVKRAIKLEDMPSELIDILHLPSKLKRTDAEIQEMAEAEQQQMQQMQQQQMMMEQAKQQGGPQ